MPLDYVYTWSDVQAALAASVADWPEALRSACAWWDGLTIEHLPGARDEVEAWLARALDPRWGVDPGGPHVLLESTREHPRRLPVRFEEVEGGALPAIARRSFRQPHTAMRRAPPPRARATLPVQIIAWHSFKGGVGRTTSAVQMARLLALRPGARVMLVDMDFEAPGITWMVQSARGPAPPIAMSDVLALVHGASPPEQGPITRLVVDRLRDALVDGLLILPALRPGQRDADIRPEHLEAPGGEALAELLSRVAEALGVTHVVVDLRAGRSELAASLLLDPRVARVLVTTAAGQSVRGTCETLEDLEAALPIDDADPAITVVVSKVRATDPTEFDRVRSQIITTADRLVSARGPSPTSVVRFTAVYHDDTLLALPLDWSDALASLDATRVLKVGGLAVDLGFDEWVAELTPIPNTLPALTSSVSELRRRVRDHATSLVTAEAAGEGQMMDVAFLRNLVEAHRSHLPVIVAIGAKGAGKTFTFLRLVGSGSWRAFAVATRVADHLQADGRVVPVTWSKSLGEHARGMVSEALGGSRSAEATRLGLVEDLDDARKTLSTVTEWRSWWLAQMARRVGFTTADDLKRSQEPVLFVFDGLEDLLPNIHTEHTEQTCLRALLQEVPSWLRGLAGHLGLIVFVRSDYVRSSIPQNAEQFRSLYNNYKLRWNREDALRLVRWTAVTAGALPEGGELDDDLIRIWGRKLGSERSREGFSNNWVLDALSTREAEVQARDLVRLLAEAAGHSEGWDDRLLAPNAIRDALREVGAKKIDEIIEESPDLGDALRRFRDLGATPLRVPFRISDITTDADLAALHRLESAGIAWREGDEYWLVSLYRRGLGIQLQSGRRERVLR